jgi:2-polyprenyl-3-methyl-5-hydroxy-6-metoxy-1,4-benzoquinol methylase
VRRAVKARRARDISLRPVLDAAMDDKVEDRGANDELSAALDRTRASYDEAPYFSAPLLREQPARMAANAFFLGLSPPDVASARVLEIGCASGGHLIPLAFATPQARYLGIDLSPVQIADGKARIARLGLANIALEARSLADLGEADGPFDYIICHGVYSWIPEPLRDDLLRVTRERLSPDGVAIISFNVLPGWRLFQIARDSLHLHAAMQADPARRAAQSRELFDLLDKESYERHSYGRFWRDEARRMAAGGDSYIAHEIFEDSNSPCTFSDFTARARGHGLAYLSEASLAANNPMGLAPAGGASIVALSAGDDDKREQYIDIFSGRSFREALLVHAAKASAIDRSAPAARIAALDLIAPLNLRSAPVEGEPGRWIVADSDEGVVIADPGVEAAIARLIARLPASSRLDDIAGFGEKRAAIAEALIRLVVFGQLAIATQPIACANRVAPRPKAWPLAAREAEVGNSTATPRHTLLAFTPLQRLLLPLLDGTRSHDDLVAYAVDKAMSGFMTISSGGTRLEDRDALTAYLTPAVAQTLESLARAGVLIED